MGQPVNPPSEQLGGLTTRTVFDLTTTRQKFNFPSGLLSGAISYRLLPGATAVTNQFARVVFNAASDADANAKLTLADSYYPLCQGDDLLFGSSPYDPITRIDVIASQAVGSEKTLLAVGGTVA